MLSISPFLVIDDNNLKYEYKRDEVFNMLGSYKLLAIRTKVIGKLI